MIKTLYLKARIEKPVGRPYPVQPPSEAFHNLLSQPVAVSGGARGMVRGSIAFNPDDIAMRPGGMFDANVNEIPRDAYLMDGGEPHCRNLPRDKLLKGRVGSAGLQMALLELPGLGVGKPAFEQEGTLIPGLFGEDIRRRQ